MTATADFCCLAGEITLRSARSVAKVLVCNARCVHVPVLDQAGKLKVTFVQPSKVFTALSRRRVCPVHGLEE